MDTVVFDFDRVLYNTPALISYAKDRCNRILGIPPQDYTREYSAWSDYVRNPSNIANLPLKKQYEEVSWVNGFVRHLCDSQNISERSSAVVQHIHEEAIMKPFVYMYAIELLKRYPRDHTYIYTAGGELDQMAKLGASGVYEILPREHIKITPAKTTQEFQRTLSDWGVQSNDRVIHINDRLPELISLHNAHLHTESVWATWAWQGVETPQNIPNHIHTVDSIDACSSLLLDFQRSSEGAVFNHELSY